MSAREPFSIWRASAELAAKEKRIGIDVSLVNESPRSCSALVREAAANTVIAVLESAAGDCSPKRQALSSNHARRGFIRLLGVPEPRRSAVHLRKRAPEIFDFRYLVDRNIRLRRVMDQIVLVVAFRGIEALE